MLSLLLAASLQAAPPPVQTREKEVRKLVHDATLRYDVRDFKGALPLYLSAYKIDARPALLFNIGQCHKHLGDHEQALFFFNGFVRNSPDSKHRAMAEELIAQSEAALALQRQAAAPTPESPQPPVRIAGAPQQQPTAAQVLASLGTGLQEAEPPPVYKRWWFWTVIGGVVVASAATTAVILATRDQGSSNLPGGSLGTVDRR